MGSEDDTVRTDTPMRDSTVPGDPSEVDVNKLIDVFERNVTSQQAMLKRMNQIRWMVAIAMVVTIALTLWSKVDTGIVRELAVGAGAKLDANGAMIHEALLAQQAMNDAELAEEEHEVLEQIQIDELLAEPKLEEKAAPGTVRYKPQAARKILRRASAASKPAGPAPAVVQAKAKVVKKRKAARAKMEAFLEKHSAPPPEAAPTSQPAK